MSFSPFIESEEPNAEWFLLRNFGYGLEDDPNRTSNSVKLRASVDAAIYAAGAGKLSVHAPMVPGFSHATTALDPEIEIPDQETANVFLEITPFDLGAKAFLSNLEEQSGFRVIGFAYLGIPVAPMMEAIRPYLDESILPQPGWEGDPERSLFLSGVLHAQLPDNGIRIGNVLALQPFEFAVLTDQGAISPYLFYDSLKNQMPAEVERIDSLLDIIPNSWPLLADNQEPVSLFNLSKEVALEMVAENIYPWTVLKAIKRGYLLSPGEWREVGERQKILYRSRLLRLAGIPEPGPEVPIFQFNDLDWKNVFQLEAITEFYMNYDDPLDPRVSPLTPEMGRVSGDLVELVGDGYTVRLDMNQATFDRIVENQHNLILPSDNNLDRTSKSYRILGKRQEAGLLFLDLDGVPNPDETLPANWWIDLYIPVSFLNPAGSMVEVVDAAGPNDGNFLIRQAEANFSALRLESGDISNKTIALLDEHISLSHLLPTRDWIFIKGAQTPDTDGGPDEYISKEKFKIMAYDVSTNHMVLDMPIHLPLDEHDWEVRSQPRILLVETFGHRISGDQAQPVANAPRNVSLPPGTNLSKVNAGFDTIRFHSDRARTNGIYTILSVDDGENKELLLDGSPDLSDGSTWGIPAGIGGTLPTLQYNLGPGGPRHDIADFNADNRGYDHFDAMLFTVHHGEVMHSQRWNTYSSREYTFHSDRDWRSSSRGNRLYSYQSYFSKGSDFRGFSLQVTDPDQVSTDGTREARHYPDTVVAEDVLGGPRFRGSVGPGKTQIRLHYSNFNRALGANSAGCMVSPNYFFVRNQLIEAYIGEEFTSSSGYLLDLASKRTYDQNEDFANSQNRLFRQIKDAKDAGNNARVRTLQRRLVDWPGRLKGPLWIIRPFEPSTFNHAHSNP